MEGVALDHNMEMAPDAPVDNHDDIEIDLDFDDEAADRDGDVVVDDASVSGSDHPASAGEEFLHDADMIDEESGEAQVPNHDLTPYQPDQPDQYQHFEGVAHQEDREQAEMEDEYEEDIDAPIPGTGTLDFQTSDAKETHSQPEPTSNELPGSPARGADGNLKHSVSDEQIPQDHANQTGSGEQEKVKEEDKEPFYEEDYEHTNVEKSPEESRLQEQPQDPADTKEQVKTYDHADGDDEQQEALERPPKETSGEVDLHNIKILYQESEISLFPPMEDDPSETYFLEDTAIVHEPVGNFFAACRVVLNDHISEEEELVLDIDPLNLHISQSNQNSSITLFEIYRLYHNLCFNDGVDSPEPLYLSLSSTHTFDALVNHLLFAAEEGKGLSSIESWDGYEQDEAEFESPLAEEDTDTLNVADESYAKESRAGETELGNLDRRPPEEEDVHDGPEEERNEEIASRHASPHPDGDHATPAQGQGQDEGNVSRTSQDEYAEERPHEGPQADLETEEPYAESLEHNYPHDEEYSNTEYYAEFHEISGSGDVAQQGALPEEPSDIADTGLRDTSQPPNELPATNDAFPEPETPAEGGWQTQTDPSQPPETSHTGTEGPSDGDRDDDAVILVHETDTHPDGITGGADQTVELGDNQLADDRISEQEIDEEGGYEAEAHATSDQPLEDPDGGLDVPGPIPAFVPNEFDLQEDFVEDQVAEDTAFLAPDGDPTDGHVVHENPETTENGLTNGSSYADPLELESGEVSPYEATEAQPENEKSFVEESPISGKRPRTDDIDTAGEAAQDAKRRRSD